MSIVFKIAVKEGGSKANDHVNDQSNDPAFCFRVHKKDLYER